MSARAYDADGVLVLYAKEGQRAPRSAPADPAFQDAESIQLRTERDAALEEVVYLKEQLCSLSAYHTHLLDEERRRMFDERTQLAAELTSLREELHRRTYPGGSATWSAREPRTKTSHADVASTR